MLLKLTNGSLLPIILLLLAGNCNEKTKGLPMKTKNYITYLDTASIYNTQNLAKTYLKRKVPLTINIIESNFEDVAEAMYDLCHFAADELRMGKGRAGGGREDLRVAIAIAADFELVSDFFTENTRNYKNSLCSKLQKAWKEDDVETLISIFRGIERNAATSMVDHRECDGLVEDFEEFYELNLDEIETKEEKFPKFVEELIMSRSTVHRHKYGGNFHKPRKKSMTKTSKQLVMDL